METVAFSVLNPMSDRLKRQHDDAEAQEEGKEPAYGEQGWEKITAWSIEEGSGEARHAQLSPRPHTQDTREEAR